jgi:Cu+-exporting ATPase
MDHHNHHHDHTHGGGCCSGKHTHADAKRLAAGEAIDPVCGMTVKLDAGKPSADHRGETYHFCSQKCRERFVADPYFYLSGNKARRRAAKPKSNLYTCPMDPEIVQEGPGTCPICGMALEPMDGVADVPNHELIDFTRRLWVSAGAAIPLVLLTMGPMFGLPVRHAIGETLALYIEFLLATPVVLWAARPFFHRGWTSLKTRHFNMWTLIMLGVGAAYGYSVIATFLPGLFPDSMRVHGAVPVYYEAAGCHRCAGLRRPGARVAGRANARAMPSARCSTWRRRRPVASRPTAKNMMRRWKISSRAIGCGFVPGKACRWMPSFVKGAHPSTKA